MSRNVAINMENLDHFKINLNLTDSQGGDMAEVVPKGNGLFAVFYNKSLLSVPHKTENGWEDIKEGDRTTLFNAIIQSIEDHYHPKD